MLIPFTDRRRQITDLFNNESWEDLSKLDIVMKEGPSVIDCGAYVLKQLGYTSSQETISVLWAQPRSPAPPRSGKCVVVYRFEHKPQIQQHGIYQTDGKVLSKWGANNPVFLHEIQDIPTTYGDLAEFIEISSELHYKLQQAMVAKRTSSDDY
jgi:hypothetical protein